MKLCIDCKHFRDLHCHRVPPKIDPVYGTPISQAVFAACERMSTVAHPQTTSEPCGRHAKHWEEKPAIDSRKKIISRRLRFWRWLTNPFGMGAGDY